MYYAHAAITWYGVLQLFFTVRGIVVPLSKRHIRADSTVGFAFSDH